MQWELKSLEKINAIVNAYVDGKISLAKAAPTLGLTRIEFERELRTRGIPVRTLSQEDIIAKVQAITNC